MTEQPKDRKSAASGEALSLRDPTLYGVAQLPRVDRDFYATPAWVTRALLSRVRHRLGGVIGELACGDGAICEVLKAAGLDTYASDIKTDYGISECDFLGVTQLPPGCRTLVFNPPYDVPGQRKGQLACDFIANALELVKPFSGQVYMLLPAEFDFAPGRHLLFDDCLAFYEKHTITERIRWFEGSTGKARKHHAWFVWDFVRGSYKDARQLYLKGERAS